MPPEAALLESRSLRDSVNSRTEVLDKVKALVLLPDSLHITTRMVADYFEVGERALNSLMQRHREELESNGFRILTGADALDFQSFNMKSTQVSGRGVAIYPRRAVLNVAMLLRDSEVARRVRTHLLDVEGAAAEQHDPVAPPPYRGMPPGRRFGPGPGPHWDEYEYLQAHPAVPAPAQYTGSCPAQWAGWEESVERRLDAHSRAIGALSDRLDNRPRRR
jgi:hypothetical protein